MGSAHQHHEIDEVDRQSLRYREIRKVTLIGSVVDLALGVAKIAAGWLSHSQALVADGIHSLSDLLTDFMVLWAAKHAHAEADEEHPYGHGRIETVATVGLGLALITVSIGIAYDSVERLFSPDELLNPGYWALAVAVASVILKEAIYHYTMWAAKKYRSNMLRANAWHSRTDAISSVVVVIGVIGTMAGLSYLDAVAAVVVAAMIGKIAFDLIWHSIQELMDAALEQEKVEAIRKAIMQVDGVVELHELRTRRIGPDALVDVHVLVEPRLSISEGHHIAEAVRYKVVQEIDEVSDVMVHVDPEDDESCAPCKALPLRYEFLARLESAWKDIPQAKQIEYVTLHYLDGMIEAEIILPLSAMQDELTEIQNRFQAAAGAVQDLRAITIQFR